MKTINSFTIGSAANKWHIEEKSKFQNAKKCSCGQLATRIAIDPIDLIKIDTCDPCGRDCDNQIRKEEEKFPEEEPLAKRVRLIKNQWK